MYMKKVILVLSLFLGGLTLGSCDDKKTDEKAKKADDNLTSTEVPAAVRSAFEAKYAGASTVAWESAHEDGKETYKAKFTKDGKDMKAEFNPDGSFIKEQ